jgi:hypothetical protein
MRPQPTQTKRIEDLESAVDMEITGALNHSIRRVIESHESDIRKNVKANALASVKTHIDALPDYAAEHVWDVLQRFVNGAFIAGDQHRHISRNGGYSEPEMPDIKSAFD